MNYLLPTLLLAALVIGCGTSSTTSEAAYEARLDATQIEWEAPRDSALTLLTRARDWLTRTGNYRVTLQTDERIEADPAVAEAAGEVMVEALSIGESRARVSVYVRPKETTSIKQARRAERELAYYMQTGRDIRAGSSEE